MVHQVAWMAMHHGAATVDAAASPVKAMQAERAAHRGELM